MCLLRVLCFVHYVSLRESTLREVVLLKSRLQLSTGVRSSENVSGLHVHRQSAAINKQFARHCLYFRSSDRLQFPK